MTFPPRALLFSGQGAQKVGMGADLARESPAAARLYAEADAQIGGETSLSALSFHGPEARLVETRICQPALYVHGLALLAAYEELAGAPLRAEAMAGLSLGEYTAHAAAGSFTFAAGLALVAVRGRLMQEACAKTEGGMAVLLGATPEQAEEIAAATELDVANLNCPGQIVLAGSKTALAQATELAKARGIKRVIPLNVAGAYHSRLMASAAAGLAPDLAAAQIAAPRVPVIANFTAAESIEPDSIRRDLAAQVCGAVRWEESIRHLAARGITHFIELGPGGTLAGLLKRIDPALTCLSLETQADLVKHADALR